jgi:hypothetical protein
MRVLDIMTGLRRVGNHSHQILVIQTKSSHKLLHSKLAKLLQVLSFPLLCEDHFGKKRGIIEAMT